MKLKQLLKISFLTLCAALVLAVPMFALAQSGSVQGGLSGIRSIFGGYGGVTSATSVRDLIIRVIQLMLMFAGIIAVVFVIVGGYQYITSGGNAEQAEKGKNTVVNAIIGIVVVVLSYVIINVIVNLVTNPAGFGGF